MRLDKRNRKEISDKLIKHRFEESANDLRRRMAAFAEEIYNDVYSVKDRTLMQSLPEGWLPTNSEIKVQFGSEMVELEFNGGVIHSKFGWNKHENKVTKRMPQRDRNDWHGRCVKVYDANDKLSNQWVSLSWELSDLLEKINDASSQIDVMLHRTTTSEGLIAKWPEVAPFLDGINNYRHVPVIQTDKLNAILDLPI
jgi:hypothetical protein